jgi:hypothetical protein
MAPPLSQKMTRSTTMLRMTTRAVLAPVPLIAKGEGLHPLTATEIALQKNFTL